MITTYPGKQIKMKPNFTKRISPLKQQTYIISIFLVLFLLVLSLIGPGLLFAVQDHLQVRKTTQGTGNNLDIEVLNASYGDKKERLTAFSQGVSEGKTYYASGMEVSLTKEEQYSIIEQAIPTYYYSIGCTVVDWKKYIIFDSALADNNASVAFMTWYIELLGADEKSLKILVDTEDLTVYYIKVDGATVKDFISSPSITSAKEDKMISKMDSVEYQFYMYDNVYDYLMGYYEPDLIEAEKVKYESVNYAKKAGNFTENILLQMYFGNHPLQWEILNTSALQAGFSDMRILLPEFEE